MTAPHVNKIDFKGIAAAVLASSETLVSELLPDGKRNGAEWTARNPTRDDRHPGSFKVNLDSGIWRDFSTEDGGGDLISLYAYLHRVDQGTAARELAERFGLAGDTKSGKRPKSGNDWTAVLPIPADAPLPLAAHPHHGQPTKTWTYHDADGHPVPRLPLRSTGRAQAVLPLVLVPIRERRHGVALASGDRSPAPVRPGSTGGAARGARPGVRRGKSGGCGGRIAPGLDRRHQRGRRPSPQAKRLDTATRAARGHLAGP